MQQLASLAENLAVIVGAMGFIVGLALCVVAFFDARRTAEQSRRRERDAQGVERLGIPADVVKVLPDLIKTSAGIAVAITLLSTVLLVGAAVGGDAGAGEEGGAAALAPAIHGPTTG